MTTAFERRTRDCQAALRDAGADAVVLFPGSNMVYLSGFQEAPNERHLLLFVPAQGEPAFVAPTMYREQLDTWVADRRLWDDGEDPLTLIEAVAEDLDIAGGTVLVDDHMWATFTQDLRATLPDAEFGLASDVLAPLRMRKDEHELDALRRAGALADAVSEELRGLGDEAVGRTESALAREIDRRMADRGAAEPSFDTIVAAGENGAKPHHRHGDREIAAGDPVVLDFGGSVDGYPGDQTRTTVFAGDPPEGFEDVFEVVLAAHHAGVEAVEPGVPAEAVDAAAREVVADAGYGEQFVHRTGHGVGLEVHEPPYIVAGNERELEPGMVFSVEPGVYLPGEFGVRIEDLVAVTDDGHERLNDSPRTWRPL